MNKSARVWKLRCGAAKGGSPQKRKKKELIGLLTKMKGRLAKAIAEASAEATEERGADSDEEAEQADQREWPDLKRFGAAPRRKRQHKAKKRTQEAAGEFVSIFNRIFDQDQVASSVEALKKAPKREEDKADKAASWTCSGCDEKWTGKAAKKAKFCQACGAKRSQEQAGDRVDNKKNERQEAGKKNPKEQQWNESGWHPREVLWNAEVMTVEDAIEKASAKTYTENDQLKAVTVVRTAEHEELLLQLMAANSSVKVTMIKPIEGDEKLDDGWVCRFIPGRIQRNAVTKRCGVNVPDGGPDLKTAVKKSAKKFVPEASVMAR